jgi:antitoxin VapB
VDQDRRGAEADPIPDGYKGSITASGAGGALQQKIWGRQSVVASPSRAIFDLEKSYIRAIVLFFLFLLIGRTMPLNIKSEDADRLARDLAAATGESITTAVTIALRERLQRLRTRSPAREVELDEIFERAARVPARDPRGDEEILGYDEAGTFG